MEKRFFVPWWVEVLYRGMEWVDYKLLSPISSKLVWWRNDLLDKYCRCEKCLRRAEEARLEKATKDAGTT